MSNVILTGTRVVIVEPPEGADMGEYIPPEWPRFLFHADGRAQPFASQAEADATGEKWYRTAQEAEAAAPPAPPAEEAPPAASPPRSRR